MSLNVSPKNRRWSRSELSRMRLGELSRGESIAVLKELAALIEGGKRPVGTIGYEEISGLVRSLTGKSLREFVEEEEFTVQASSTGSLHAISLLRGVVLSVDEDMRPVSLSILPAKLKEREKLMAFVGIGRDLGNAHDVAEHHDEYLVDAYLNKGTIGQSD